MKSCKVCQTVFLPSIDCPRCEGDDPDGVTYEDMIAFIDKHPDGATLEEVGEVLGITRERVRQIEFSALRKLRRELAKGDVNAPGEQPSPFPALHTSKNLDW